MVNNYFQGSKMTDESKPPMFGPSMAFDPASYEPRSGKSVWNAGHAGAVASITGTRMIFSAPRSGMSWPVEPYQAIRLTSAELADIRGVDQARNKS